MANNCYVTLMFKADKEKLQSIFQMLTEKNRQGKDTFSFRLIEGKVPGIRDEELYKMLGCDYNRYVLAGSVSYNGYTEEEAAQWHEKVCNFVNQQGWMGLRDSYVNERIWEFDTTLNDTEDTLTIKMEMAWYAPYYFYIYVAKHFQVEMIARESVEGNFTHLIYYCPNEKNYVSIQNNIDVLVSDKYYQKAALDIELFKPQDIIVAYLAKNMIKEALQLSTDYEVSQEEFFNAVDAAITDLDANFYNSSPITDFEYEEDKLPSYLESLKDKYSYMFHS